MTVFCTSGLRSIGIVSGDQPTLVTWPSGLHQLQRRVERTAGARRVAHEIGAERIEAAHDLLERLPVVHVDDVRGAERARRLEPRRVARQAGDDQRVGAGERRHPRAQQADRSGAEHDDQVARAGSSS